MRHGGGRIIVRSAFVVYTAALLVATHWPGLAIHGPFTRTDLVIHAGVYFIWTLLVYNSGWMRSNEPRRLWAGLLRVLIAGLVFCAMDELTQPFFQRTADWLDFAADATGALLACGVIWACRRLSRHDRAGHPIS